MGVADAQHVHVRYYAVIKKGPARRSLQNGKERPSKLFVVFMAMLCICNLFHCFQRVLAPKMLRGGCIFRFSNCGNITLVCWRDNKNVIVLCTDPRFRRELENVKRRDRNFKDSENRTKDVPQPLIINRYIKWMRGVDLACVVYVYFCFI